MSLIDEALKRARQEASRQDAAAREARYARVPNYVPPVRRSRSWLLPVVVAACLVVGAAAGVLMSRSPQREIGPQTGPHPLAPSPAPPPALPGRRGTPAASPLPLTPSPARPPAPSPSGRGGTPAEVVEIEKPALPKQVAEKPAVTPAPQPTPAPAPAPPSASVGPVVDLPQAPIPETRSYVREMPLEGGAVLRLNGIAFSEKPVALFGDKVLAPGESAGGGFTVVEIEAKRVKLQGPGGAVVYVSLR